MVGGAALDRIRAGNTERNLAGVPASRESRSHGEYAGAHRERQIEIAKQLFGAMGIERHDKEGRQDWVLRGFRQFDVLAFAVVTYDRSILDGRHRAVRLWGAVTNALAFQRGLVAGPLGCVVTSLCIMQSPVVREHAGIPEDQVIMICVAMGYPDDSFPANAVVSRRKSVDDAVVFVGFDD